TTQSRKSDRHHTESCSSKACAGVCHILNTPIFRDSAREKSRLGKLLDICGFTFRHFLRHFASLVSGAALAFAETRGEGTCRGEGARALHHSARIVCMITC